MRFLLLVVVVVLTVTNVSGSWWKGAKDEARRIWNDHKDSIIHHGVNVLLKGRSINDVDQNGDGVLTRSELQQHMNERDVDDLLDMLDLNGEEQVTRDALERYANEELINAS